MMKQTPIILLIILHILINSLNAFSNKFIHLNPEKISLNKMKSSVYDLIVWDCDGVLVDSEAL